MSSQILFGLIFTLIIGVIIAYPVHLIQHDPSHYDSSLIHNRPSPLQYQQTGDLHASTSGQLYQAVPVAYSNIEPTTHHETAEQSHGQQSSGHSSSGYNEQNDKAAHANAATAAHSHHAVGGQSSHGTHNENLNHHGTYQNLGTYSEDKGSGFEKSYSFDTATGYHDIEADDFSASQDHGSQTKQQHHNVGDHSEETQESHGAHSKTGSSEHGSQSYDNALFKKYGYSNGGKNKGYSYSPVYGYGYH